MGSPKTSLIAGFTRHMDALADTAQAAYDSVKEGKRSQWTMPPGFNSNLTNLQSVVGAFSRVDAVNGVRKSVADSKSLGTVGDLILCTFQGDMIAVAERSFRLRHMTTCRAKAHAAGRRKGQAGENGTIKRGIKEGAVKTEKAMKGEVDTRCAQ